ncbi:MAG: Na+/H+ antiporter NhaC family protein [Anaerovoracaceae bacterium]
MSGGAHAFAASVGRFVNSRAKAQMAGWVAGIMIFFSDIGSPIIAGPIVQPLTDKMKVSRESWPDPDTTPPFPFSFRSSAGSLLMGLMGTEFQATGYDASEWDMLLKAWPFQFYALLSLFMVPLVAFTKKEFGPMYKAEKRALAGQVSPGGHVGEAVKIDTDAKMENSRPMVMIIPLLIMVGTLCFMLCPQGFPFKSVDDDALRGALITGFVFGSVANIILVVILKIKSFKSICQDYVSGLESIASVFIVLLLAWVLSSVTKAMGGPEFVVNLLQDNVPAWILPVIIFAASAVISFSTGSSWGTFAIMMTIAVPAAIALNAPMHVAVASVLSGGLFGDHCSPISDTTILSANGARCDLLAHVKTQLPYALMVGCVTIVTYAIAGLTGSILALPVGIALLIITVLTLSKLYGKKVEE